jgi:hypothetical protein
MHMAKSTSIAELHPQTRTANGDKSRTANGDKRASRRPLGALERRAKAVAADLSTLPMKPLLIGAGIGAALFGAALAVTSKRTSDGSLFTGMNQTLTKSALVALAHVLSGQTVRSAATSALLDVADAMKKD